jgi:hypothetical protein
MCNWISRLVGMLWKKNGSQTPKRPTVLQRLKRTCVHDILEHERHPKGSGQHQLESEPESKPDSKQRGTRS